MDEVGVAAGDCEAEPAWGDAVPDEGSLPFFLDNLLLPALESCSC